jgi:hypothetical protein
MNRMTQQTDVLSLHGLLGLITLTHSVLGSKPTREVWSPSCRGSRMRLLVERHRFCSYSIGFHMHLVHQSLCALSLSCPLLRWVVHATPSSLYHWEQALETLLMNDPVPWYGTMIWAQAKAVSLTMVHIRRLSK